MSTMEKDGEKQQTDLTTEEPSPLCFYVLWQFFPVCLWLRPTFDQALAEMKDPNNDAKDDDLAERDTDNVNREFLSLFLWVQERVGLRSKVIFFFKKKQGS